MTAADSTTGILSDPKHRVQLRRAVIASTIGTTIEWYDFLLYSIVTGLVFAKLFFPASDPLVGAMQAYAIFFVGFIARPVGAALFGHWGDRIGRKAPFIAAALFAAYHSGMAIACYLLACGVITIIAVSLLPDYTNKDVSREYDEARALGGPPAGEAPF